jgi:hypothetical protein
MCGKDKQSLTLLWISIITSRQLGTAHLVPHFHQFDKNILEIVPVLPVPQSENVFVCAGYRSKRIDGLHKAHAESIVGGVILASVYVGSRESLAWWRSVDVIDSADCSATAGGTLEKLANVSLEDGYFQDVSQTFHRTGIVLYSIDSLKAIVVKALAHSTAPSKEIEHMKVVSLSASSTAFLVPVVSKIIPLISRLKLVHKSRDMDWQTSHWRIILHVHFNEMAKRQRRELIVHLHIRRWLVRGLKVHTFFFHTQKSATERDNQDAFGVAVTKETKDANNGVNHCG